MQYTRKFIRARFQIAMEALGVPHGETYVDGKAQVGVYSLDYYYGYQINKIANAKGGESCPFGTERRNAREFVAMLDGIINAAYVLKGQ